MTWITIPFYPAKKDQVYICICRCICNLIWAFLIEQNVEMDNLQKYFLFYHRHDNTESLENATYDLAYSFSPEKLFWIKGTLKWQSLKSTRMAVD